MAGCPSHKATTRPQWDFPSRGWRVYEGGSWTNYVNWSSSNTSVATVNSTGYVTPNATGGSATISATELGGEYTWSMYAGCYYSSVQMYGSGTVTVQKPTRLVPYDDAPCAPNGVGPVQNISGGSVVDCGGVTGATNFCGVNGNLTYRLVDQDGNPILDGYTIQESFSNFSTTNNNLGPPSATSTNIPPDGIVTDAQFRGFTYPACLGTNDHSSYDQLFSVIIGTGFFNLSTTVSISLGRFNGTYEDNVTITTP